MGINKRGDTLTHCPRKNRRGDISTTILVVGVFAICSLALLSFYLSGIDSEETFSRLEIIKKVNSIADEIRFYKNQEINKKPEEIMGIFQPKTSNENLVYSAAKIGDDYKITATLYENKYNLMGFGFGERIPVFSVDYSFKT
ncbi:MAG: hypothetical protein AABX93_00245 [Nanoarchaeota archaeon]